MQLLKKNLKKMSSSLTEADLKIIVSVKLYCYEMPSCSTARKVINDFPKSEISAKMAKQCKEYLCK